MHTIDTCSTSFLVLGAIHQHFIILLVCVSVFVPPPAGPPDHADPRAALLLPRGGRGPGPRVPRTRPARGRLA